MKIILKRSTVHSIRKWIGKELYFVYLPVGFYFERIKSILNSLGRQGTWLNIIDSKAYKTSDTLYILGSGGSINRLTDKQWQDISKANTFGLNHWLVHPFVPTFYAFENSKETSRKIYFNNLEKVWDRYRHTLMIYKDGPRGLRRFDVVPEKFRKRLKVLDNPSLPIQTTSQITLAMNFLKRILDNHPHQKRMLLLRKRASLLTALEFAYVLGYKHIVLCGIDLNTTEFFYDRNRLQLIEEGFLVPTPVHEGGIHRTENPVLGQVTVSQLIKGFNEVVLQPAGIKLWIGSQQSALAEWLPYYWDGELNEFL